MPKRPRIDSRSHAGRRTGECRKPAWLSGIVVVERLARAPPHRVRDPVRSRGSHFASFLPCGGLMERIWNGEAGKGGYLTRPTASTWLS